MDLLKAGSHFYFESFVDTKANMEGEGWSKSKSNANFFAPLVIYKKLDRLRYKALQHGSVRGDGVPTLYQISS